MGRDSPPIYQDTESCGFYGPTILIQYALGHREPRIHNIWTEKVGTTLSLIEWMMEHKGGVIGYNNAHDSFHYSRTYGILSMLPRNKVPDLIDYHDVEQDTSESYGKHSKESYSECRDAFCVKPYSSLDLMLYGRKDKFQSTMNQKDIRIKKVPRQLAKVLVKELSKRVTIPDIYFSKSKKGYNWEILPLHEEGKREVTPVEVAKAKAGEIKLRVDPHFVNIRLRFSPSTAMKVIAEKVLGYEVDTIDEMNPLPKVEEYGWWPWYDGWFNTGVIKQHIDAWSWDKRRLKYAANDVIITRAIDEYLGYPDLGDDDSELAFAVGAMYWRGFSIDLMGVQKAFIEKKENVQKILSKVNVNSPVQVKNYLHSVCDPLEQLAIPDTKGETLKALSGSLEWKESNPKLVERVKEVLDGRHLSKEIDLLDKLLKVGRLHVTFKVIGTKSNRMSGGSESFVSKGGSINPQGIKKGDSIRSLITLAYEGMYLSGGDFDSFEVAIAEARYKDPNLREQLLKGLKFHGIMGAIYYNKPYEFIVSTSKYNKDDPEGYYARAKTADFAWFYGAMMMKLSQALNLTEEETEEAFKRVEEMFPKIREARELNFLNYAALRQPEKGGAIAWHEPKEYVESFLDFKRYFTLEYSIIRSLYELAQEVYSGTASDEIKDIGKTIKVTRTDRLQTGSGALCSALYGAAFGIQGQVQRSAGNHEIQSPGGQLTKGLERKIWDFQPSGCKPWLVMPMNIHDEIQAPVDPSIADAVEEKVKEVVESYKQYVPLVEMQWDKEQKSWGKK